MIKALFLTVGSAVLILHFTGSPLLALFAVLALGILFILDTGTGGRIIG